MSLLPGQFEEQPPEDIVGYAVLVPGTPEPALYPLSKRPDAERYAARMHSVAWPLVIAKRKSEKETPT